MSRNFPLQIDELIPYLMNGIGYRIFLVLTVPKGYCEGAGLVQHRRRLDSDTVIQAEVSKTLRPVSSVTSALSDSCLSIVEKKNSPVRAEDT